MERALSSRTFARSEQLRAFLNYICEAELRSGAAGITEYVIGVEVLHRPCNYSPSEDSSVRTRAYELRQKLEKLYAVELPLEPVQIVIPKGSYVPQFVRVAAAPIGLQEIKIANHAEIGVAALEPSRGRRAGWIAAFLLAGLAGAALSWPIQSFLIQGRRSELVNVDPIVAEAWGSFGRRNDTVLLVAATPLVLVTGPATHKAFGSPTFPAPAEAYPLFREHRPLAPGAGLGMIFANTVGIGTMNAVVTASNVVRALGATPQILPERPAMMSVLRGRDAILFGAPVDSQAITEILDSTPLSVVYDEGVKEFVISDRISGRTIVPEKDANGDFRSVYGLVTVLNTRESDAGRLGMVVFSGITSVGTHGAAEYFSSPRSLRALRSTFVREGLRGFPPAYQVVVKCKFENMLLVAGEYYSHRILSRE